MTVFNRGGHIKRLCGRRTAVPHPILRDAKKKNANANAFLVWSGLKTTANLVRIAVGIVCPFFNQSRRTRCDLWDKPRGQCNIGEHRIKQERSWIPARAVALWEGMGKHPDFPPNDSFNFRRKERESELSESSCVSHCRKRLMTMATDAHILWCVSWCSANCCELSGSWIQSLECVKSAFCEVKPHSQGQFCSKKIKEPWQLCSEIKVMVPRRLIWRSTSTQPCCCSFLTSTHKTV